jgi:DNA polymerase-3 subunit alpha
LKPTYGVLVYQEQAMRIAQKIAGFNLQEADELRKALGKKKADLMAKVKKKFISGAKKVGTVSKEDAEAIFGWIEKSARYSFNKSHSISYAVCSYLSAFQKAHNTKEFFLSYLYYANEKQDPHQEIYELISEAKLFDITVKTPSIINYKDKFNIQKNTIYFGLKDIKSLTGKNGDALIEVLSNIEKDLGKSIKDISIQHEIIVDEKLQHIVNELSTWQWKKDKSGEALPIPSDKNNHSMDALRYALDIETTGLRGLSLR